MVLLREKGRDIKKLGLRRNETGSTEGLIFISSETRKRRTSMMIL